jgi:ATP-dependent DNA helicase RecQ
VDPRASESQNRKPKPAEETVRLLEAGHTLDQIAQLRGRQVSSVVALVAEMVERGELEFRSDWIGRENARKIETACSTLGIERLRPLKDALPPEITFDEIRLVAASLRARQAKEENKANAPEKPSS